MQSVAQECNAYRPVAETKDGRTLAQQRADQSRASYLKKKKKLIESSRVQPGQETIVRFVTFREDVIEKINGKYRPRHRVKKGRGLQVKNRIYLANGTYKLVNRTSLRVAKVYSDIPSWANQFLRDKYHQFISKLQ